MFLFRNNRFLNNRERNLIRWANEDMIPLEFDYEGDQLANHEIAVEDNLEIYEDMPLKPNMKRGTVFATQYGST